LIASVLHLGCISNLFSTVCRGEDEDTISKVQALTSILLYSHGLESLTGDPSERPVKDSRGSGQRWPCNGTARITWVNIDSSMIRVVRCDDWVRCRNSIVSGDQLCFFYGCSIAPHSHRASADGHDPDGVHPQHPDKQSD
jgi:hypothetical protein